MMENHLTAKPLLIAHIADLHIGNGDPAVYRQTFHAFAASLDPNVGVVVIAGDVFHHKTRYSGDDVELFMELLRLLEPRKVVVIPGNHDTNLNDIESLDLLYPLRDKFTYLKESGVFDVNVGAGGSNDQVIKFRHVSVFDVGVTTADVMSVLQPDEILLYHGIVCGAKFGKHTAHDRVITREIMDRAWIVMLGDIHEHQFVAPRAAYPGSLIQQNTGESVTKGYIVWDYDTRGGRFVSVKGESSYVRLDLRGKSQPEIADAIAAQSVPGSIIKLSVLADDATSESDLAAVREKFGRIDMVKVKHSGAEFVTKDTVLETLREMLTRKGMSADDVEECVADYASNVTTQTRRKWYVTAMKWDNMFKYGPGNSIDFASLEGGIAGVIAANRAGKSSIIDILVFGLFGVLLRGTKESMINFDYANSFVRVDFVSGCQRFYISREDDRASHTKIELYEDVAWNGSVDHVSDGRTRNHVPTWVNRTLESTTKTHELIRKYVGGYKQFLSTGLYYDRDEDVALTGATNRMRVLADLFGLNDNEKILKELKDKKRGYEILDKALKIPVDQDDSKIISLEQSLADAAVAMNTRSENLARLVTTQKEIELRCKHRRPVSAVEKEIKEIEADIAIAQKHAQTSVQSAQLSVAPRAYCTAEDRELSLQHCRDVKEICADIAVAKSMLDARFKGIVECAVEEIADTSAVDPQQIADVEKRLLELRPVTIDERAIVNLRVSVDTTKTLIETIEAAHIAADSAIRAELFDIDAKIVLVQGTADTTVLETQIAQCDSDNAARDKISVAMVFGDCDCCRGNKQLLQSRVDKRSLKDALESAQVSRSALRDYTLQRERVARCAAGDEKKYEREIAAANAKLSVLQEQLCNATRARDAAITRNEKAAVEREKLSREFDIATAKASVEHRKRVLQNHEMNQSRIRHNDGVLRLRVLEPEYAAASAVVLAKRKCIAADNYFSYISHRVDALQKELIRSRKEEHRRDRIAHIGEEISVERSSIHAIDITMAQLKMSLEVAKADGDVRKIYDEFHPKYTAEMQLLKQYIDCLGSQGLRTEVVKKYVERVITQANLILSAVTDFTINCTIDTTMVELSMCESSHNVPVSNASGFQKFVISIAIRLSLVDVLPASSDFIIIDEGFGCVDKKNLKNMIDFMSGDTLNSYKFVFVVSHIDDIANMISRPLYIREKNRKSYLEHGNPSDTRSASGAIFTAVQRSAGKKIAPRKPEAKPEDASINTAETATVANDQFRCSCGAVIKKTSKGLHMKSKKHADAIAKL